MVSRTKRYTALALLIGFISLALSLMLSTEVVPSSILRSVLIIMTGVGISIAVHSTVSALSKYPSSLQILLIGPPGVGKTVFLTVLFRQLETGKVGNLIFAPFGDNTALRVARNFALLASRMFPPPTTPGQLESYEAVARFGGPFGRHYRIQVFDSAGEHLAGIAEWHLNEPALLRLILHGDAVIMMVDCERILCASGPSLAQLEASLITTLNAMIEKRTENPTLPFAVPVALVFSKADVLEAKAQGTSEGVVLRRFDNLIAVASRRCRRFRYFFVSSLGETPGDDGAPPEVLQPVKVTDPLMWILRG